MSKYRFCPELAPDNWISEEEYNIRKEEFMPNKKKTNKKKMKKRKTKKKKVKAKKRKNKR